MILSHQLQMTADEFAVFEPLALSYIELCYEDFATGDFRIKENWGVTLQGMLSKLKRGETVEINDSEFLAPDYGIWSCLTVAAPKTRRCSTQ